MLEKGNIKWLAGVVMSCFFIYNERSMKINLRIVFFRLKAYGAGLALFVLAMVLSSVTALHAQNGTGVGSCQTKRIR